MLQISPHVYQISLGSVNVFLIEDNGLTLIDTGDKNSTDKIFAAITKGGKNPNDIKRIILTHLHPDHTGSAAELKSRLSVPVIAHREDASLIEQGIAGRTAFEVTPGIVNWLVLNLFIKKAGTTVTPVTVEEKVKDDDMIPVAGGIRVIHTPGHSAGHIALLIKNEGVLIAGDICANVMGLALSTVYEDTTLGIQSIAKAAAFDFTKAVFGHGKPLQQAANNQIREKFKNAKSTHVK